MKVFLILAALVFGTMLCEAHKEPIHERIATNAVLSSDGMSRFMNETLGSVTNRLAFKPFEFPESVSRLPIFWVGQGAYNQDYWPRWANHFYTVRSNRVAGAAEGASDGSESIGIIPGPRTNSFAWATGTNQTPRILISDPEKWFLQGPPPKTNDNTWRIARECEYAGLTNSLRAARDTNLAHMFYSLGHIIHLNQDASQPDHTRNDAHVFRVQIETYGRAFNL